MQPHEGMMTFGMEGPWLLIAEMSHRVANEYGFAMGSLSLAARRVGDENAKTVLADVSERLFAFSKVHRALLTASFVERLDLSDYLSDVCVALSRAFLEEKRVTLIYSSEPLELNGGQCWRIGLILAELIANAARHAFAREGGEIKVDLLNCGSYLQCKVSNNGQMPSAFQRGSGATIVDALTADLGGSLRRTFGQDGARVTLVVPM